MRARPRARDGARNIAARRAVQRRRPRNQRRLYQTIRDIHRAFDCTIVFVSHDFNEAATLADRVGIVLGGKLRAIARSNELFTKKFDEDVMRFLGSG